jgi:prepilin-type N-terminal cleavage/methylation domain-containing protein/prepilin-type processing-associated H-X9-DG protein
MTKKYVNGGKKMKKKESFTLIELLVVIAIIAILASMLLPALTKAREKAKSIKCAGNFKSLDQGQLMYAVDYDDYLPVAYWRDPNNTTSNYPTEWKIEIAPYIGSPMTPAIAHSGTDNPKLNMYDSSIRQGVFLCPSYTGVMGYQPGGYGWNYYYMGYSDTEPSYPRVKIAQLKYPSETFTIAEFQHKTTGEDCEGSIIYPPAYPQSRVSTRHSGGTQISWVDGHVTWMRATQLWTGTNGDAYWYWRKIKF